jgi:hypothetical protein
LVLVAFKVVVATTQYLEALHQPEVERVVTVLITLKALMEVLGEAEEAATSSQERVFLEKEMMVPRGLHTLVVAEEERALLAPNKLLLTLQQQTEEMALLLVFLVLL